MDFESTEVYWSADRNLIFCIHYPFHPLSERYVDFIHALVARAGQNTILKVGNVHIMFGGGRGPLENVSKFGQKPSKQRLKEARRLPGGLRRLTTARPPAGGQERPERMETSGSTSASKHYSKKCGYRSNPLSVDTNTYLLFFYL